jgi:hypothetical protein
LRDPKFFDTANAPASSHPSASRRILNKGLNSVRESSRVSNWNQQPVVSVAHDLTATRYIRRDYRPPARRGLEKYLRQAFTI